MKEERFQNSLQICESSQNHHKIIITQRLNEIILEVNILKKELARQWELKNKTDKEVLDVADKIDGLLNEHDYLMQQCKKDENFFYY